MTATATRIERPVLTEAQIEQIANTIIRRGLVAIVAAPFRDDVRLSIELEVGKLRPEAKCFWRRSPKAAEKVLRELLNSDRRAAHVDGAGLRFKGTRIEEIEPLLVGGRRLRQLGRDDSEVRKQITQLLRAAGQAFKPAAPAAEKPYDIAAALRARGYVPPGERDQADDETSLHDEPARASA